MSDSRDHVRAAMHRLLETEGVQPSSRETVCDHGVIHHLELGSGPPILLLHGGTGGGANWFRQIGPLSAHGRVLAPDLPGFGLSDPVQPERPLGRNAAELIDDWLQRVAPNEPLLVAGTSFGGLIALRLAQRSDRVRALFLLDSAGLGRRVHAAVRASATPLGGLTLRSSNAGARATLRTLLTHRGHGLDDDRYAALGAFLHATASAAGLDYMQRATRAFATAFGQREVLSDAELRAISVPTTVMWGAHDAMLPLAHGRRAARLIPDAELRIVDNAGHSPNWETPAEVVSAIVALAKRMQ